MVLLVKTNRTNYPYLSIIIATIPLPYLVKVREEGRKKA